MNQLYDQSADEASVFSRASRHSRCRSAGSFHSTRKPAALAGSTPVSNANSRKLFAPKTLHYFKTEEN